MCWMSSNSSMATPLQLALLHLVEHCRHRTFHPQCLLDLVGGDVGIFPIFQKAWALMVPKELDNRRCIGFPIVRPALKVYEHGGYTGFDKECDRVFNIFVKIGVENSLIHEMRPRPDVENHPS